MPHTFFVTCPKGLEYLLADEMTALGFTLQRHSPAGVWLEGELRHAYRACLWSRLANRVVLHLATLPSIDADELYQGLVQLPWEQHLPVEGRLKVDFSGSNDAFRHTQFGAQRVKDAIVDRLRQPDGRRPQVDLQNPDLQVYAHLHRDKADIGIDLAGESLHRRGYRTEKGIAPLKENLAAALLIRAGWPALMKQGAALIDPMCGAGTLLIEAAWMAEDRAPGLTRPAFAFERWPGHADLIWQEEKAAAQARYLAGKKDNLCRFWGSDQDDQVLKVARRNAERAGVANLIQLDRLELAQVSCPAGVEPGLLITNPPYAERLGERREVEWLYRQLGEKAKSAFQGWQLAVFTGVPELCHGMGLRSHKQYRLFNGRIAAQLLLFRVDADSTVKLRALDAESGEQLVPKITDVARADMFANRLKKNLRNLGKWARSNGVYGYRLYDADMPEYAIAIDIYEDWVHVQEYAPPASIDPEQAAQRLAETLAVIPKVLSIAPGHLIFKQRRRQKGLEQYEKLNSSQQFLTVREGACKLQVNLKDYLDTGLFLDHRPIRLWIASKAKGKRFLNLFCYTGAATVHAAVGGATSSLSIDMSRTYLSWAETNLQLNGIDLHRHRRLQTDCLKWLDMAPEEKFDLIFLDPPTFSNSARMDDVLDVQRDHERMIEGAMRRLAKGGELIFSTNYRRFKLAEAITSRYCVENITSKSIDRDFARNTRIHQCWRVTLQ